MKSFRFIILLSALTALTADGDTAEIAAYDRNADSHGFTVFMKESGWCWFQDPRAILHDGKLFMGAVKGHGDGQALVGVYNVDAGKQLGSVVMNPKFDRDDHNSPVFHVRSDGSVLSVYARHHDDRFHYFRVSNPADPLKWSEESKWDRDMPNASDKVTYMNFHEMKDEGKLYLFFRGIDYNPTYVTSSDDGGHWSEPVHFFTSEVRGHHRPYARYAGNGKDTVYVSITDAHPRDFGNSIYYFEFRNGRFYRADGTMIKVLADKGPLKPSEAECVYKGSMTREKPAGHESVPGAAWTSSMAVDRDGYPHIAYSVYLSNDDHRYRIASWDGKKWIDREVAFAGGCLYERESSYTGLITLDPVDPTVVFISSDVDPNTGESHGGHHEIFRAKIKLGDATGTIRWKAVTHDSPVQNIRPNIVRDGNRRIVLWQRGDFKTFTNYQLDTVGFIEKLPQ